MSSAPAVAARYAARGLDELPELWDGFARLVRADAGVGRVLASGPEGLRVLCIGAVPGAPYEPPAWTAGVDG